MGRRAILLRTKCLEQLDDAFVPVPGGPQQRRPTVVVLRVDVGLARREQLLDDAFVPVPGGPR